MRQGLFLVWVAVSSAALLEQSVLVKAQIVDHAEDLVDLSSDHVVVNHPSHDHAHHHSRHPHHKKHRHDDDDDDDDDNEEKRVVNHAEKEDEDDDADSFDLDFVDEKHRHRHIKHAQHLRVIKTHKKKSEEDEDDDDEVADKKKKHSHHHRKHPKHDQDKKKKKKHHENKLRDDILDDVDDDHRPKVMHLSRNGWDIGKMIRPITTFFRIHFVSKNGSKHGTGGPLFKPFDGPHHSDFFTPSGSDRSKPSDIIPNSNALSLASKRSHDKNEKRSFGSTLMHTPVVWVAALLGLVAATIGLVMLVLQRNGSLDAALTSTSSSSVLSDEAARDIESATGDAEDESADESEEEADGSSSGEEKSEDGRFENVVERVTV